MRASVPAFYYRLLLFPLLLLDFFPLLTMFFYDDVLLVVVVVVVVVVAGLRVLVVCCCWYIFFFVFKVFLSQCKTKYCNVGIVQLGIDSHSGRTRVLLFFCWYFFSLATVLLVLKEKQSQEK